MEPVLIDKKDGKTYRSDNYNFTFDKNTGFFARWGKTEEDDPQISPFPEILDIEVTTACSGVPDSNGETRPCAFCYKSNGPKGTNMTFETFKTILDKMPPGLTQIAFGADSTGLSNPDLFKMIEYTRSKGIVPNITLANISPEVADKIAALCGACAVSRYENKNICYDSVLELCSRGMKQVNIHQLVSQETFEQVKETMRDMLVDPRLQKMNALVLLSLKRKGRGSKFTPVSYNQFKELVDLALSYKISFGMDSCSAHKFLNAIKDNPNYGHMAKLVEPCEATCFSSYINSDGKYYPCSFAEDGEGIDVVKAKTFNEVWNAKETIDFREKLLLNNRHCPIFTV